MARPKPWIPRIGQILVFLEKTDQVHLNREQVQKLFDLGRSAATQIMIAAGFTRPGSGYVSRDALLFYVRNCPEGRAAGEELERRQKLAKRLDQDAENLKFQNIKLPVSRMDEWTKLRDLENVSVQDGLMTVAFSSPHDLMGQLYRFVKAAGNEWDVFMKLCEQKKPAAKKAGCQ